MSVLNLVVFFIGFLAGMVTLMVVSCLVVASDADDRIEKYHEVK